MKWITLLAVLMSSTAMAAPYDLYVEQRNPGNTATIARTLTPMLNTNGLMAYQGSSNLPAIWRLGNSFMFNGTTIESASDWVNVTSKPNFATVAFSGNYNDLSNKPSFVQANSDWLSVSGPTEILNKPFLATVATTGSYADLSGAPAIPAAQVNSDWSAVSGKAEILNKPTSLAGYGITDAYPLSGNPSSFITQAGARSAITLTTTGTSGASTYNGTTGVLNIPNYAPGTGTVTSITAGTGLSGGVITASGTISMPSTGTSGTYSTVTTDAQGRVTSGVSISINDSPGRSLVTSTSATGYQVSATRVAEVCYEGSFSTTSSIGGPSSASVFLETADTNSTTPGDWTTKAQQTYSNTITLAVVLNQVQGNNWSFCRYIPAGKYVRIRAGSITGTASASLNASQQETLH